MLVIIPCEPSSTLPYTTNGSGTTNGNGYHSNNNNNNILNNMNNANGGGVTTSTSSSLPRGFKADKFEIPLPFGYHLDLDFLRFCSEDLVVSGETLEKLKDLRRERRQQRKTLEALMGYKQV